MMLCEKCSDRLACLRRILTRDEHGNHPLDVLCASESPKASRARDLRQAGMSIERIRRQLHCSYADARQWIGATA